VRRLQQVKYPHQEVAPRGKLESARQAIGFAEADKVKDEGAPHEEDGKQRGAQKLVRGHAPLLVFAWSEQAVFPPGHEVGHAVGLNCFTVLCQGPLSQ